MLGKTYIIGILVRGSGICASNRGLGLRAPAYVQAPLASTHGYAWQFRHVQLVVSMASAPSGQLTSTTQQH